MPQFNNCYLSARHTHNSKRHRKIIIHVPVKLKKEKHTHTLIKPLHVHHKSTIIKEEVKPIIKEIHKPIEIHKEIHHKPIEIHKEIHHPEYEIKRPKPIYKEEISHEHLHHHYKHVHPDVSSSSSSSDYGSDLGGSHYAFQSSHP